MAKQILTDHKKEGKVLKPPLSTLNINSDTSWIDDLIPEVIWISLLIDYYGLRKGVELSLEFIKIATKFESNSFEIFAFLSSFENMPRVTQASFKKDLKRSEILEPLQKCLREFLLIYNLCPIVFLRNRKYLMRDLDSNFIERLKKIIIELVDKTSKLSTFTIATVIYSQASLGRLVLAEGSPILKEFPKIQEYPDTEISKKVASLARASINAIYVMCINDRLISWPNSFWQKGIELEKCLI